MLGLVLLEVRYWFIGQCEVICYIYFSDIFFFIYYYIYICNIFFYFFEMIFNLDKIIEIDIISKFVIVRIVFGCNVVIFYVVM